MQQHQHGAVRSGTLWAALMLTCTLTWAVHHHKLDGTLRQLRETAAAAYQMHHHPHLLPGAPAALAVAADTLTAGGLAGLEGAPLVMLSYTNAAYLNWTLNWAGFVRHLGVPHAVIAFDAEAAAGAAAAGIPLHDASADDLAQTLPGASVFRENSQHFRAMGHVKVKTALQLMRSLRVGALVLSDPDVVWLRHPAGLLELFPSADVMVSTDCLSAAAVAERREGVPRCQMLPGGHTSAWNTGVVVARATPAAEAALAEWAARLAPDAPSRSADGWWVDDQLGFSEVLDEGSLPWQAAAGGDAGLGAVGGGNGTSIGNGVLLARNRTLAVAPLPPLVLANGHVAFEQRLPEQLGAAPFAVHVTFQLNYGNHGKIAKLRENNLWLLERPEWFQGRFLTYGNMVQPWVEHAAYVWRTRAGRPMAALHKHLLAAAFQLQVLAEALAAGRALGRAVVPPRFWCYCSQDSAAYTDMLDACATAGTDAAPPLECGSDVFLNVQELQSRPEYERLLRFPNFLAHLAARDAVRRAGGAVATRTMDTPAGSLGAGGAGRPMLPLHATARGLEEALAPSAAAAVVDLGPLAPGWLASVRRQADVDAVMDVMYNLTATSGWCCTMAEHPPGGGGQEGGDAPERQDMRHAFLGYAQPVLSAEETLGEEEAAESGRGWRPPAHLFERPEWCDTGAGYLLPHNQELARKPQHPCAYLEGTQGLTAELEAGLAAALAQVHSMRVGLTGGAPVAPIVAT